MHHLLRIAAPRQGTFFSSTLGNDIYIHLEYNRLMINNACRGIKVPRDKAQRAAWRADSDARARVTGSIVNVLKEMWNQRHEIPLIACFRKEVGLAEKAFQFSILILMQC